MNYALFANADINTDGGWEDLIHQGTLQECLDHPLGDADWAHIIDLGTGDWVHRKQRRSPSEKLDDVPWHVAPGEWTPGHDDAPQLWRTMLTPERLRKLARLGDAHWLQSRLDAAEVPELPAVASAAELLDAVSELPMPVVAPVELHGFVSELKTSGLIDADVYLADHPGGDHAIVLAITDTGRALLASRG